MPSPEEAREPTVPTIHDERGIYRALGLEYVEPELRENTRRDRSGGARHVAAPDRARRICAAPSTTTPPPSDGNATLRRDGRSRADLGLSYLGVADHSKSSFQRERSWMQRRLRPADRRDPRN